MVDEPRLARRTSGTSPVPHCRWPSHDFGRSQDPPHLGCERRAPRRGDRGIRAGSALTDTRLAGLSSYRSPRTSGGDRTTEAFEVEFAHLSNAGIALERFLAPAQEPRERPVSPPVGLISARAGLVSAVDVSMIRGLQATALVLEASPRARRATANERDADQGGRDMVEGGKRVTGHEQLNEHHGRQHDRGPA
jgi:hypothetical protein